MCTDTDNCVTNPHVHITEHPHFALLVLEEFFNSIKHSLLCWSDRSGLMCPQSEVRFHNVWSHECLLIALTWVQLKLSEPRFWEVACLAPRSFGVVHGHPLTFPLPGLGSWAVGIGFEPGMCADAWGCLNVPWHPRRPCPVSQAKKGTVRLTCLLHFCNYVA